MIEVKNIGSEFNIIETTLNDKTIILNSLYGTDVKIFISAYEKIKFLLTYILVEKIHKSSQLNYCFQTKEKANEFISSYLESEPVKKLLLAVKLAFNVDINIEVPLDESLCIKTDIIYFHSNRTLSFLFDDINKLKTFLKSRKFCIIVGPNRQHHHKFIQIEDTNIYVLNKYQYEDANINSKEISLLLLIYKDYMLDKIYNKRSVYSDFEIVEQQYLCNLFSDKIVIYLEKISSEVKLINTLRNSPIDKIKDNIITDVISLGFKFYTDADIYLSAKEYSDTYLDIINPANLDIDRESDIIVIHLINK